MPTRRALVSATDAAATGMHSASSTLALSGATATIAFWKKNPNAGGNNTMFSSSRGEYHVINFNGSLIYQVVARGNGANTTATTGCSADTWDHVTVQWGLNIDGTADLVVWINGVKDQTLDTVLSNELFTAGYHFLMGDDNPSGVTDDGWQGRLFDVVLLEGIHAPGVLNYNTTTGDWKDVDAGSVANIYYRIDGQNASDPGEDSSGNARNFVVENAGITTDIADVPPGANPATGLDLNAPTGVYALSGQTVSVTRQLLSSVATGSYALSGQAPTLTRQYQITAAAGVFALTGHAPDLQQALTIDAAAGVYSVTGEVPVLQRSLLLTADLGSYALTGAAPSVARSLLSSAAVGAYAVTGNAPDLRRSLLLQADAGSYTLTGLAPDLRTGTQLDADAGTYTLTGLAPTLLRAYRIGAVTGDYTLTGLAPTVSTGVVLEPDAGAYALSGLAPSLLRSLSLAPPAGEYTQTGPAPTLSSGLVLNPETGEYAATGYAPLLLAGRRLVAEAGVYTLTGAAPEILRALRLDPGAGIYVVTGLAPDMSGADTRDPHVLIVSVAEDNVVQLVGVASGPFVIISQED